MTVYVVLESANAEPLAVRVHTKGSTAMLRFQTCAEENGAQVHGLDRVAREAEGTIAIAGDDAYCVQVFTAEVMD